MIISVVKYQLSQCAPERRPIIRMASFNRVSYDGKRGICEFVKKKVRYSSVRTYNIIIKYNYKLIIVIIYIYVQATKAAVCTLKKSVEELMSLITNKKAMEETMVSVGCATNNFLFFLCLYLFVFSSITMSRNFLWANYRHSKSK